MSWIDGLKHRVRTLVRPGDHARDVDDEMRFHVELDVSHDPRLAATPQRFGNRTYYREEVRQQTWLASLDVLRQDLGYAWRTTRRSPGFTAVVVVTLALGIGVNAATFSVLDRFYLRAPRGIEDPSTLRRMWISHNRTADGVPFNSQAVSVPVAAAIAS
jgi:putative ABC transport system permease protein